ncbi:MAG: division/cell wall cluster transcriptional repressor MraZ [Lachnospiraceae bacterium]
MFMGEFDHTTDPKGRLIVPSKFREELGDTFVVTKGLDGCLLAYAKPEWDRVTTGLRELSLVNKNGRQFIRFFFAGAAEIEMDKQGRILIPEKLREFAGITKDVVSVGADNKLEIWSKDRYEGLETPSDAMDEIMERLSEMGIRL